MLPSSLQIDSLAFRKSEHARCTAIDCQALSVISIVRIAKEVLVVVVVVVVCVCVIHHIQRPNCLQAVKILQIVTTLFMSQFNVYRVLMQRICLVSLVN